MPRNLSEGVGEARPYQACWVKEGHASLVRFVRHEGKEGEAERREGEGGNGPRRGRKRGRKTGQGEGTV